MSLISVEHNLGGFQKDAPPSPANPGKSRYCYLFPELAIAEGAGIFTDVAGGEEETILRLLPIARWLERRNIAPAARDAEARVTVPAAYTYFGQFVNHDLSAPVGGMLKDVNAIPDADTIGTDIPFAGKLWRGSVAEILLHFQNEHKYPLRLYSLYGEGPFGAEGRPPSEGIRALFDGAGRFVLGKTFDACDRIELREGTVHASGAPDIPRQTDTALAPRPLIADLRNDGNLILSQLHLALMLFHNKAMDALKDEYPVAEACFAKARQLVTRHYHWCILHDFLPTLLDKEVVEAMDLAAPGKLTSAEVPLEFTTAAFRFGHSMVADSYDFNANFGKERKMQAQASLGQLFSFTTAGKMGGLGAHSPLPDHWVVDWDRLTDPNRGGLAQSEGIDMSFAKMMMDVAQKNPDKMGSIIARNLARGFHRRIPFGQALAAACGLNDTKTRDWIEAVMSGYLNEDPMFPDVGDEGIRRRQILSETPAWLYFLWEAKARGGNRLGPTASCIIRDTFLGLMKLDADSILGANGKGWTPQASPLKTADDRPIGTIRDLLLFAVAP